MEPTCPQCHTNVRATDYFCFNCGKKLKEPPLSTSFVTLLMYYLGAVALPPMGIIWGIKYVRQASDTAKIHGAILIGITVIELIFLTFWTVNLFNIISSQVGSQMNGAAGLQGF